MSKCVTNKKINWLNSAKKNVALTLFAEFNVALEFIYKKNDYSYRCNYNKRSHLKFIIIRSPFKEEKKIFLDPTAKKRTIKTCFVCRRYIVFFASYIMNGWISFQKCFFLFFENPIWKLILLRILKDKKNLLYNRSFLTYLPNTM